MEGLEREERVEGGGESFRCFHNCYEVPAHAVNFMMRSI